MLRQQERQRQVPKLLTGVLYFQAALATFVGVMSILGQSGFAHDAADGRRIGVGFLAFALLMVALVIPRLGAERRLILVPLAWTASMSSVLSGIEISSPRSCSKWGCWEPTC